MLASLAQAFARAKRERRLAFVPYVMAGDPDLTTTQAIVAALDEAGADVIELGVPYSDPLADGPTIASAGARALGNGTQLAHVLEFVQRRSGGAPLLLFTYFNVVYRHGIERFAQEAAAAGAVGAIVPDLSLEESAELRASLSARHLEMPLLIAPSTPLGRAVRIADAASGFVYVVSRLGVTGAGTRPPIAPLEAQLEMLRGITTKALAVGFGVSRAEDVRAIAPHADGVVVGSALIDAYAGLRGAEAARRVSAFVAPLIAATHDA